MLDRWPDNYFEHRRPTPGEVDLFMTILNEAVDERPLQAFLKQNPHFLSGLLGMGMASWCFDRPEFGSEHIPDFLLCTYNSTGYNWVLVEIESPTKPPLTKAGLPSSALNTALSQIRDWRAWLRQNIAYAQSELGLTGIHAEVPAAVIIGRRTLLPKNQLKRYEELSTNDTLVMTWDRVVDRYKSR